MVAHNQSIYLGCGWLLIWSSQIHRWFNMNSTCSITWLHIGCSINISHVILPHPQTANIWNTPTSLALHTGDKTDSFPLTVTTNFRQKKASAALTFWFPQLVMLPHPQTTNIWNTPTSLALHTGDKTDSFPLTVTTNFWQEKASAALTFWFPQLGPKVLMASFAWLYSSCAWALC